MSTELKKIFPPLLILFIINISCNGFSEKNSKVDCFTSDNFDSVYSFIKSQFVIGKSEFYVVEKTEIHLTSDQEITFKSNGYTFSKVNREKGIISLPIKSSNNDDTKAKTTKIFCKILSEIEKK